MPGSINVGFTKDALTIVVPGPPEQTDIGILPRFVTDTTANHTRWVYQLTSSKTYQWSVPLMGLTGAQKTALQSFYDDVAKGPTNPWKYTHTNNSIFNVRFIDTSLQWTRRSDNEWDVSVRLETADAPL